MVKKSDNAVSFEDGSLPPPYGSKTFLLETKPLHKSASFVRNEARNEFLVGARALGFEPTPQQLAIADVLNSEDKETGRASYETVAVCVPRRAGKTTVILAVAIGRCLTRPNYQVLFTAQSGTKASARYLQMARELERVNPDQDARGFRILRGAGHQVIYFANGSLFQVLPPKPEAFRGDSADLLILDEAQEHDVATSAELMGAILPTMDTRPGAQIVVAGTAGERRSGLFWDALEEGRRGVARTGVVEFAAPDTISDDDAALEETWVAAHPGIGTLTSVETIRARFEKLPRPQFMREYLGVWPVDYGASAIDRVLWADALTTFRPRPQQFAIAFDVPIDQSTACIAAAWREGDDWYIEVIDHRLGVDWLGPRLLELARKYQVTIGHDTIGSSLIEAEWLARQRPRPKLQPASLRDVVGGCNTFMKELQGGRLHHAGQASLDAAVEVAVKRPISENSWAWNRRGSGGDITPLVACTLAMRTFDKLKPTSRMTIVTAKAS